MQDKDFEGNPLSWYWFDLIASNIMHVVLRKHFFKIFNKTEFLFLLVVVDGGSNMAAFTFSPFSLRG